MYKIEEIEKMVRTGEVWGRNKETLLGRGQESLGEAAEKVYLGKERKREKEKKELRGERIKTLKGYSHSVLSVVFSPDGEYLASGSSDNTIGVWRVSSGERIKTLKRHSD